MLKISQKAVIKACKNLSINYEILHPDNIVVKVELNNGKMPLFFRHHYKPFNRSDISGICKDKDFSYELLQNVIQIPRWKTYLAPNCDSQYKDLLEFDSNEAITQNIIKQFQLPVILKMNKGSQGINVFKCINRTQILKALNRIFDRSSPHYDYLAISQKFIEISEEYRVIAWRGEVLLTYKKDNDKADFEGNLSPLHWKNARAIQIKDPKINAAMQEFLAPIFETLPIDFFGADVAIDPKNKKFLLEINGSPGVSKFVKDNSLSPIIQMYEKIFQDLIDSKENTK